MEKKNLYNVLRLRMTDTDNNKLLIEAVKDGKNSINFNIICRLLEEGVDVNAKDEDGITADIGIRGKLKNYLSFDTNFFSSELNIKL